MNTNNPYQQNSDLNMKQNPMSSFGYDLKSEKQEIEEITREIKSELLAKWKKSYANVQIFPAAIALMHPEVRNFLLNFNLVLVYDNIARQANIDSAGRNVLPKIVWEIAQSEKWESLDEILEAQLQLTHSAHVQVASLLKQEILDKIQVLSAKPVLNKVIEHEVVSKKIKFLLAEAIAKYPKIAEQNITADQIKIRTMPYPVRPSIKNWIADFQDVMGAKKHSPIDRGNYLFHSENTKKLTVTDRQKLGTILKSLDEETLLTVDAEAKKIVFDEIEQASRQVVISPRENSFQTPINIPSVNVEPKPFVSAPARNFSNTEKVQEIIRQPLMKEALENVSVPKAFSQPEKTEFRQEEKVENFFQIPGSKPPIGTQDYFTHDVPGINEVKKEEVKVQQPAQEMLSIPKPQSQNISYVQNSAPKVLTAILPRDLETASDDELFEAMKQRKPLQKTAVNQNTPNRFRIGHVDNSGGLNFSSPQQLPVEQKAHVAQSPAPQIASRIAPQIPAQPERESFHISPRGNTPSNGNAMNKIEPRVSGNTVNLRD